MLRERACKYFSNYTPPLHNLGIFIHQSMIISHIEKDKIKEKELK
jgi:hypothetical protein